jgi:MYXO-CTERM domain-containing protein
LAGSASEDGSTTSANSGTAIATKGGAAPISAGHDADAMTTGAAKACALAPGASQSRFGLLALLPLAAIAYRRRRGR